MRDADSGRRRRWKRSDYAFDAATLAQKLIGALVVRRMDDGVELAGRIVETEAYVGVKDQASHAFGGRRTPRVEPMYGVPGTAYVYFTYGMHFCFNVVAGRPDEPVAVLVRALRPVEGIARMREHRGLEADSGSDDQLCRGPANICRALRLDRAHSGIDMVSSRELWVASDSVTTGSWELACTPRIGLRSAGDWTEAPLRWLVRGERAVSGRRGGQSNSTQIDAPRPRTAGSGPQRPTLQ